MFLPDKAHLVGPLDDDALDVVFEQHVAIGPTALFHLLLLLLNPRRTLRKLILV